MKKRNFSDKKEMMTNEASHINNKNYNFDEKSYSIQTIANKSKSLNRKMKSSEEFKQLEVIIEKKYLNFNLDFIYRRQRYTLKNLFSNYLISKIKKLISKKILVDINLLHLYHLDKEIINDKLNVYDMIRNNKIKYLEVKKEFPNNEDLISLNTNIRLIYKVRCTGIKDVKDFIVKIETFFRERCLEKHYLCEPIGNNIYDVGFSCDDNRFQFKRYMMIVKKIDNNYINTKYQFLLIDKNEILEPGLKFGPLYRNSESIFNNKGPYIKFEEIKKRNEREEKKKRMNKKDFIHKK